MYYNTSAGTAAEVFSHYKVLRRETCVQLREHTLITIVVIIILVIIPLIGRHAVIIILYYTHASVCLIIVTSAQRISSVPLPMSRW